MKRRPLMVRITAILLTSVLSSTGCTHSQASKQTGEPVAMTAVPSPSETTWVQWSSQSPYSSYSPREARPVDRMASVPTTESANPGLVAAPGANTLQPIQALVSATPPDGTPTGKAESPVPSEADAAIQHVSREVIGEEASFHNRVPPRRSYIDLTARACFQHAEDYSWLSGRVQYSQSDKQWRLRYTSLDESDGYGGSVVLTGNAQLSSLKDGQSIRVTGHVVDPQKKAVDSSYQVTSFRLIEPSH